MLEILVPALRKRPDDIPVLANHFLEKFRGETGRKIRGFTPRAMEKLTRYRWPGNVRELRNVIERAVVLCRGEYIDEDDLLLSNLATAGDTMQGAPHRPQLPALLAGRHGACPHPGDAEPHRLEQEPHGQHPGDRALHAGPQDPPLRPGETPPDPPRPEDGAG